MQLKEITTQKDFYSLSTVWNSVLEKSGSNTIFSTFEWLYTWWEKFGKDKKLFILLTQDRDEVIGIAPLMISKRKILKFLPVRVLSFIGTGISDYADFIIIKERVKIVNLFLKYLQKRRRIWDELDLREIREDSPNLSVIDQNLKKSGYVSHIHTIGKCMYIKTKGGWDTFYSSFSSKKRNNISRQYKRIIKNSLKYSFSIFRIDTDNKKLLDDMINIHLDRMEKKNKVSILGTEEGSSFYKELINKFESSGLCRLDIMRLNGNLASYTLGFQYGNKYYHWNVGINNKYADYAPGKLLLINILKDCFSSHEIDECDFLRGEENYKYRLTNLYRKNYRVTIYNNKFFILAIKIKAFLLKVKNRTIFSNESLHIFTRDTLQELPDFPQKDNINLDIKVASNEEISNVLLKSWSVNREKRFEEFLAKKYNCIIAKDTDNNIWGYIWIGYETYFLDEINKCIYLQKDECAIIDAYVAPYMRRKGLYKQLCAAAINESKIQNYKTNIIACYGSNEASIKTFSFFKFKKTIEYTFLNILNSKMIYRVSRYSTKLKIG